MQICGGVTSGLRSRLIGICPPKVRVPDLSICDGNGAMVAISGHMSGQGADSFSKFDPGLRLPPQVGSYRTEFPGHACS